MSHRELPIPAHFDADKVAQVWRVPYQDRAREAQAWAQQHDYQASGERQSENVSDGHRRPEHVLYP